MEIFAVIMAGGVGKRFWPRSKQKKPKQLLRIFGENTMIQDTVARLKGLVKEENIFIITNKIQKPRVIEQLTRIPEKNIIAEPFGKNTAACIGLASVLIKSKNKDAVMVTLPADHMIGQVENFNNTLRTAAEYAYQNKGLVTIGVQPNRPETGYGYIQLDEGTTKKDIYPVLTFAEKPNLETAKRFMEAGDFMWNSGMFIWRADVIQEEIKKYMPELFEGLEELDKNLHEKNFYEVLTTVYGQLKNVSIDYGIMEKSDKVFLIKGNFDWSDVGSWESVYHLSEKDENENAKVGDVYTDKVNGSYIFSPQKFTAVVGLENVIVINTDSALLVCKRDDAQSVKEIVDYLKFNNKSELL